MTESPTPGVAQDSSAEEPKHRAGEPEHRAEAAAAPGAPSGPTGGYAAISIGRWWQGVRGATH